MTKSTPTDLQLYAMSRVMSADAGKAFAQTIPDDAKLLVEFDAHVRVALSKGRGYYRRGTAHLLTRATVALLLRRMGVQREAATKLLTEVLQETAQLSTSAEQLLLAEHPEVGEAFAAVEALASAAPPIPCAGRVTAVPLVEVVGASALPTAAAH